MLPSSQKPFCLADFEPFLRLMTECEDEAALIGGMAVSAWAELFLEESERAVFDLPIYSKDIDFRGLKASGMAFAERMRDAGAELMGMVTATRKNAPHMGRVFAVAVNWRGERTSVEVLERLPGLDASIDDAPLGTPMTVSSGFTLLDPCSLFICKLHAANTRPGEAANNDEKHLAILARVIPRFLEKVHASNLPDYDAREDAQRLLLQIEASLGGRHPFVIPLPTAELEPLIGALQHHLKICR